MKRLFRSAGRPKEVAAVLRLFNPPVSGPAQRCGCPGLAEPNLSMRRDANRLGQRSVESNRRHMLRTPRKDASHKDSNVDYKVCMVSKTGVLRLLLMY
jgi:hypothetical protein